MICVICYNNKITIKSRPNNCQHIFCYKCLKEWHKTDSNLNNFAKCPVCRKSFNSIEKLEINNYEPRITRSKTRNQRAIEIKTQCSLLINKIKKTCDEGNQEQINEIVYEQSIPEILRLFYNNKWFLLEIEKMSSYDEPFLNVLYTKLDEFEKMGFVESKIWKWKFKELLK
tara:strand:- start:214 stop:726 length:513 start_codon:yes stop_codon:yes gene_type:complete